MLEAFLTGLVFTTSEFKQVEHVQSFCAAANGFCLVHDGTKLMIVFLHK